MTEPSPTAKNADSMSATWSATSLSDAEAAVKQVYGASGSIRRLSSERDETFLFTRSDGKDFILKIANPAEDPASLEFQDGALMHLEAAAPNVPVPRLMLTKTGAPSHTLSTSDGPRVMRLLTFLGGELQYRTSASETQSRNVGRALAQLGLGLEDYKGRPPAGKLMWDISHTLDLVALLDHVGIERRAQAADLDTDDRIGRCVEATRAAEHIERHGIGLHPFVATVEAPLGEISQYVLLALCHPEAAV